MATAASLITVEDYVALPDSHGCPTELVKGVLHTMVPPMPRHGQICGRISHLIQSFLDHHDIGQILTNDSGVVTEQDPDTVRGADIAFYSYRRVPKGPLPSGLLDVRPELVFEVRSPNERWSELHEKVAEYLKAGVLTVCIADDDTQSVHVYYPDRGSQVLRASDEFAVPEVLEDFCIKVQRFFD